MVSISAVTGDVAPSDLGVTLFHEHLVMVSPGLQRNWLFVDDIERGIGGTSIRAGALEAFVAAARFLEAETPLRFSADGRGDPAGGVMPFPGYQSGLPGGAASGRSLVPAPFEPSVLGKLPLCWRNRRCRNRGRTA